MSASSPFSDSPRSPRTVSPRLDDAPDRPTQPLLSNASPCEPPVLSTAPGRLRIRSLFQSTATSRRRTHVFLLLSFIGLLFITAGAWDDNAIKASPHTVEDRLKDWREYWKPSEDRTEGPERELFGSAWKGTGSESVSGYSTADARLALEEAETSDVAPTVDGLRTDESIGAEVDDTRSHPSEDAHGTNAETQEQDRRESINVRPVARYPSKDPAVRYLSFENHSGFHNQRKSLVNALVLARLLNRTLLLPPARLGHAIPWGPGLDLSSKLVFSEECKAGFHDELPIAPSSNSIHIADRTECDDPRKWTYVAWDWLISPELFDGRDLVDRWNSSRSLFTASLEEDGGLGLDPEEIHEFQDDDRRSYMIYDSKQTPTQAGLFKTRIDLEDLNGGPLAEKRLLQFGSLFSGARLNLANADNRQEYERTFNGVILANDGIDGISDQVRDLLGSYVAIHARTGSQERGSVFWKEAKPNMISIFRKLTHAVLGLKAREVDRLVRESSLKEGHRHSRRFVVSSPKHQTRWQDVDDLEERDGRDPSPRVHRRSVGHQSARTQSARARKPLSPSLHCRKPLWPSSDPTLSRLNIPLYIATDSPSPSTEPSLRIFYDNFPCLFVLDDFISPTSGVSDVAAPALERLAKGGEREWLSDYDQSNLGSFLFPFLEAEIAARAVEVVGTKGSTFSSYAAGNLHEYYETRGLVAPWDRL